jgi:hypothetical protein
VTETLLDHLLPPDDEQTGYAPTPCQGEDAANWLEPKTLAMFAEARAGCLQRCHALDRCRTYARAAGEVWVGPVVLAGRLVGGKSYESDAAMHWDDGSLTWHRHPRHPEREPFTPTEGVTPEMLRERVFCDQHGEPVKMRLRKGGKFICLACQAAVTRVHLVVPLPLPRRVLVGSGTAGAHALERLLKRLTFER